MERLPKSLRTENNVIPTNHSLYISLLCTRTNTTLVTCNIEATSEQHPCFTNIQEISYQKTKFLFFKVEIALEFIIERHFHLRLTTIVKLYYILYFEAEKLH